MGDYSRLYVGSDRKEFLAWKYDSSPPLLAMLFEPKEKEVVVTPKFNEVGEPYDHIQLRYQTNVGAAIERLKSIGLTYSRVEQMAADCVDMSLEEFDSALKRLESPGEDSDESILAEVYFEEVSTEGPPEIAELLLLWPALDAAQPDDPVTFDASELSGYFDSADEVRERNFLAEAQRRLRRRLQVTSALLDFLRKPSPEAIAFVRDKLGSMSEGDFLHKVVRPILEAEGYAHVRVVRFHGPNEFGADIAPMRIQEMGKWYYVGAQAKAERVSQDEVSHIRAQVETALGVDFIDESDNVPKRLDRMLLFLAKGATSNAMKYMNDRGFSKSVRIFDSTEIAELVLKNNLLGSLT